jgi:MFS family permease
MNRPDDFHDERLASGARRRAMLLACGNAALWAIGNGLVSSTLMVYLALGIGARNFQASVIYAAPLLAGLLRLMVPTLLARLGRRKFFCIGAYVASALVLFVVPLAAAYLPTGSRAPVALVIAWCVYHLLEFCGNVALWSWTGDLVPRRIRGRFCGYRERWLVSGRLGGIAFTIALAWLWEQLAPRSPWWQPLAISAACGAVFMLLAVVPLVAMPAVEYLPSAVPRTPWRAIARAMGAPPYRQLVLFSCAFSFVNGITAAAQGTYPSRVLKISYQGIQTIIASMRAGQTMIAPTVGRWCDEFGSRPVMIVSQLVVATGPLFLLMATREQWWWLLGAYLAWIAYAGLNVGLDNIKLKLAPADNNVPYLTVYYAMSDLVHGASFLLAGWLFDRLEDRGFDTLDIYAGTFLVGWIGRTLVATLLVPLDEPGAWRVRELLNRGISMLLRGTPTRRGSG